MIADFFFNLVAELVEFATQLLPTFDLGAVLPSLSGLVGFLSDMNYFLPIAELSAITMAVFTLGVPFITATLTLWLVALIRGGSSRG